MTAVAKPLVFRRWSPGDDLEVGALGLAEPLPDAPHLVPEIMFVPLAAFDARGHRIVYGGGGITPDIEVELDTDAVQSWLKSLTDIRLSLAVRLGIENEEDAMLVGESADEAIVAMSEIYDWLGHVQETLISLWTEASYERIDVAPARVTGMSMPSSLRCLSRRLAPRCRCQGR